MGNHKYIKSPEIMAQLFDDYKKETKENPRKKHVFVGKDGKSEFELLERPLTYEGFSIYCFEKIGSIKHYFENRDDSYTEFVPICSHIKEVIRRDQVEGGMVGQYNPSITQRLNGLVEKQQNEVTINQVNANFGQPIQSPSQPTENT